MSLLALPDETLYFILWRLAPRTVLRCGGTCRRLCEVVRGNSLWCYLYARSLGGSIALNQKIVREWMQNGTVLVTKFVRQMRITKPEQQLAVWPKIGVNSQTRLVLSGQSTMTASESTQLMARLEEAITREQEKYSRTPKLVTGTMNSIPDDML